MRFPEPDVDVISDLLKPETWLGVGCPETNARRFALASALAWCCGATIREMERLTVGDLRGGSEPAVSLPPSHGGATGRVMRDPRLIPLTPPAQAALSARMAERPDAAPGDLLLGGGPAWDANPRGVLDNLADRLPGLTGGRVAALGDLSARYRRYLAWGNGADPTAVAWLSGKVDNSRHGRDPTFAVKRRLLAEVHPALLPSRLKSA